MTANQAIGALALLARMALDEIDGAVPSDASLRVPAADALRLVEVGGAVERLADAAKAIDVLLQDIARCEARMARGA